MMKQILLPILLLFFLTFPSVGCQDREHTAITLTKAEALMYTHPDSVRQMLEAIPDPEQLTGREQADYALLLTQARHRCNVIATSDSLIQIAVNYFDNQGDKPMSAKAWLYLGNVYIDKKDYSEATFALKHAESCITSELSPRILSMIHNKLGYMNRKDSNYPQAFFYFQKAMAIDKHEKFMDWYVSDLTNILNLPLQEVTDSASVYINQMLENLSFAHPDLQAKTYNNIAVYYEIQEKKELAEYYYQKAIQTSKSSPYRAYLNLAQIYDEQKKTKLSDSLLQQALHTPVWATRAKIYETLYHRFLDSGRYQEAQAYIEEYLAAVDSFYTQQKEQQIREIQAKYDNEVLVREKAEVENRLYRTILCLLLFIVLSIGITLAWRYHWKRKQELYFHQLQGKISQIGLLENEKQQMEKGIQELKDMLAYTKEINQIYVQQLESKHVTLKDAQALGLYLRLLQDVSLYNASIDYPLLCHWLDIVSQQFAYRLITLYPQLSFVESNLCCLKRLGFSISQIATALHIKEDSVIRNIYRVCDRVKIAKNKEEFNQFILRL